MSRKRKIEPFPHSWMTVLTAACLVFFLAEFTYQKQHHLPYEHWFGFYSFMALGATIVLSLIGSLLRPLLWRKREYYDG